jgi:aminoglycoside 6'-N-acetyltransferase
MAGLGCLDAGAWHTRMVPPTLRAGRIALRPLGEDEVDELVAILTRPGVREWWGSLEDPEHTREGLINGGAAFSIQVDGTLAGWVGYNEETDPDHRYASLDIFLAPEYQGRRLGPAALRLAAEWLFEQRGHHRLTIDPACQNARAIRAYAAVGFRTVGAMRCYERGADGRWHDNLLMDLLREELRDDDQPVDFVRAHGRRDCGSFESGAREPAPHQSSQPMARRPGQ